MKRDSIRLQQPSTHASHDHEPHKQEPRSYRLYTFLELSLWAARNYGALVIIALFVLLLPLSTPRIYATDEVQYYAYLRSLYFDGDLDFANEYQYFAAIGLDNGDPAVFNALLRDHPTDPPLIPATGLYRNVAPIGAALMWSPGYVVADMLVHVANLFGAQIPADGYSWPYIAAVCFMSALYALLGLLLTYRIARRYSNEFAATLATVGVWLATPLIFYTYILMPWSHATGFFLFALFLTLWLKDSTPRLAWENKSSTPTNLLATQAQRSWGMWALLGLIGGLMTITREQLGLLLIIPATEGLVAYWRLLRSDLRVQGIVALLMRHIVFLVTLAIALIPQILVYQTLYGRPRPSSTVSGKLQWSSPHFFGTLFDPAHGALIWSPILAIGLLGLFWLWKRDRLLAALLLLGFLAQTYINGAFSTWHLSGSFGFRRLIDSTPIFVLGLAPLLAWLQQRIGRWPLILGVVLLVGWNIGLIANWTVLHPAEVRPGLPWPELWGWQLEAPLKVLEKANDLLFNRCKLVENGC